MKGDGRLLLRRCARSEIELAAAATATMTGEREVDQREREREDRLICPDEDFGHCFDLMISPLVISVNG